MTDYKSYLDHIIEKHFNNVMPAKDQFLLSGNQEITMAYNEISKQKITLSIDNLITLEYKNILRILMNYQLPYDMHIIQYTLIETNLSNILQECQMPQKNWEVLLKLGVSTDDIIDVMILNIEPSSILLFKLLLSFFTQK